MPSSDAQLNPFTRQYKPSVFSENVKDPKMGIPQNEELFKNINAKFDGKDAKVDPSKTKKKFLTEEENIELQIQEIRDNMKKTISGIKEPNHCEFMHFIMTNYDYKHDYWKLNRDLTLKLKEEDDRDAFQNSEDIEEFK